MSCFVSAANRHRTRQAVRLIQQEHLLLYLLLMFLLLLSGRINVLTNDIFESKLIFVVNRIEFNSICFKHRLFPTIVLRIVNAIFLIGKMQISPSFHRGPQIFSVFKIVVLLHFCRGTCLIVLVEQLGSRPPFYILRPFLTQLDSASRKRPFSTGLPTGFFWSFFLPSAGSNI